ncbi:hypothetical protein MKX01_025015 [Papaver californicum]|nr:hypothetical protein MKX01_025015 [Papaver californicum]
MASSSSSNSKRLFFYLLLHSQTQLQHYDPIPIPRLIRIGGGSVLYSSNNNNHIPQQQRLQIKVYSSSSSNSSDGNTDFLELSDEHLMNQCEMDTFKSSGPGGKHRNMRESAVYSNIYLLASLPRNTLDLSCPELINAILRESSDNISGDRPPVVNDCFKYAISAYNASVTRAMRVVFCCGAMKALNEIEKYAFPPYFVFGAVTEKLNPVLFCKKPLDCDSSRLSYRFEDWNYDDNR